MREHYGRTIRAWLARLEQNEAEATALLGEERVRVWRLYLAGGALAFEDGRMGVDQILAVNKGPA
jgi:cyclopropane-fatty-acyl-phospholipid synthase